MEKNLGILIAAALNKDKTIEQINEDLKSLENQIVELGLTVRADGLSDKVKKDMAGVKKAMQESVTLDTSDIEKTNQALSNSIKDMESSFGASTEKIVENARYTTDETGKVEKQLQSYVVTMRTLSDELKHVTYVPEEDPTTGREIIKPRDVQTIDDSARALKDRERVLQEEYKIRKRIEEMNQREAESRRKMGTEIGRSDQLKDLNRESREHLETVIRQQDEYQNLEIMEHNVNETTGKWTAALRLNGREQINLAGQIDQSTGAVHKQSEAVKEMAISNQGVLEQFKVAMARVPVWMAGMTLFYAPLRGLRSAIDDIIMLDTHMTTLKRVMDTTPHMYNNLIEESIELSIRLGNEVDAVAEAMTNFARQGYDPEMLMHLTETATVLSNISELSPDDAMDTITAGLKAFDIEARDSLSLIDRINEVGYGLAA